MRESGVCEGPISEDISRSTVWLSHIYEAIIHSVVIAGSKIIQGFSHKTFANTIMSC